MQHPAQKKLLHWHRYLSELKRSTTPWTRGNAQEPPRKFGQLTSKSQCCLYRVIFNYDPRHLLSLTLELLALLRPLELVIWKMRDSLVRGALGRHLSLWAYSLGRPSARIPAVIATTSASWGSAWYPMAAPFFAGVRFLCHRCTSQRCAVREPHDLHICMRCEYLPTAHPTPVGGGDPWATPHDSWALQVIRYGDWRLLYWWMLWRWIWDTMCWRRRTNAR